MEPTNKPQTSQQPGALTKLTVKEQRFVAAYVKCWDGAKAARKAGYSPASAKQIAYENLTKPYLLAAIKALAEPLIMTEQEGAVRLTEWARGSIAPFLVQISETDFALSLSTRKAQKHLHLIKKIKQTRQILYGEGRTAYGEEVKIEIELHDAKDAVIKSLELQGKLKGVGDTNVVIFQLPDNGR